MRSMFRILISGLIAGVVPGLLGTPAPAGAASRIEGTDWYPIGPAPIVNAQTYPDAGRIDATGRASVIAVNPLNPDDVYLGTATGGVWRSTDGGRSWQPFFEQEAAALLGETPVSIGAIAVDDCTASRCNSIYVGTGENSLRRDTYWGAGLLVGGWTSGEISVFSWTLSGGSDFKFGSINDIVIDPTTSGATKRLYLILSSGVTASASESTVTAPAPAAGYGLFRSTDDAGSWTKLTVDGSAGAKPTDLEIDPQDPQTLYAGFLGRGIFRSDNDGGDWCPLNPGIVVAGCSPAPGLPDVSTNFDFVEIAVHRPTAAPAVLYAMFGNCPSPILGSCSPPIYKSTDGGTSWDPVVASSKSAYSRYTHTLEIHPDDPDVFYFGGINLHRWNPASNVFVNNVGGSDLHPDHHSLVFPDPADSDRIYVANDGGFYFSEDGGECWTSGNDDLQITGFQSITASPLTTRVIGGTQDNGTNMWSGTRVWQHLTDSDSASTIIDLDSQSRMYDLSYLVAPRRTTTGAVCCNWPGILNPDLSAADPSAFYPPFMQAGAGSHPLYFGTNRLYRSTNDGSDWTIVSPVLGGIGPFFPDIQDTNVITAIAVAPTDLDRVWVGYYDGRIWRSNASGPCASNTCWTEVTTGSMPSAPVTRIAADPGDSSRAYATFSGFSSGAHVFRTDDDGDSWQAKASGLPSQLPVNTVHVEVEATERVWLGTDAGVYKSLDHGDTWTKFSSGLPNVPVYEIALDEDRGRAWAGTHGRGAFLLTEPMIDNYEGWVDGGIWDIPVYGTGFPPNETCTMRLVLRDGATCAQGMVDGDGGTIETDADGQLVTSKGGFYIDRPVAWGCFNSNCVGGAHISACNDEDNPVTFVEVGCGALTALNHINGCPQQANPPTSVLGVDGTGEGAGTPDAPCLPPPAGGAAGGGGAEAGEGAAASPEMLLHVTPTVQVGDGSTRTLCTVAVAYRPHESRRTLIERIRDEINASLTCAAAGVSAEATGLGEELGPGIEDPMPEDPRLVLHAPTVSGSYLVASISAQPGGADGLCFDYRGLGDPLSNQLEIVRLRFRTAPTGAEGGAIRIVESTPLGRCDITVDLAPGDTPTDIAGKVAAAFQAPGIPGPHPRCPARRNLRDVTLHGDSVISVAAWQFAVCLEDPGVGFLFDPEEVKNRHPVADAGDDRTAADPTAVLLDGRGSSDPDSTPGTADDIASYDWLEVPPAGPPVPLASGATAVVALAPGLHRIRLRVTDVAGAIDLDEALIEVDPLARLSASVHLNQAFAKTDGPQLGGVTEDGTTELRAVAIRLGFELTPDDRVVVQVASRARGDSPLDALRDDVELSWAFYERRLGSTVSLAGGRVPVAAGLFGLRRDDGVARPFYDLAWSLYDATSPLPEAVDGLRASGRAGPPAGWHLEASGWVGGWDQLEQAPGTALAGEARSEDAFGAQLWLAKPSPHVRLGLGLGRFDLRDGVLRFGSQDRWEAGWLSAEVEQPLWFVRAELLAASHDWSLPGLGGLNDVDRRGGYLEAGVRPLPTVTLALRAEATELELPFPFSKRVDLDQDLAIGAAWSFRPEAVLKLELHRNEGYRVEDVPTDLVADPPVVTRFGVLSLAVSF